MLRSRLAILMLLLFAVTLAVYWPVRGFEFVNYDDGVYVASNAMVRQGLNADTVRWAFTSFQASNWHPLTMLSHMADCTVFGPDNAGAHHLVNAALHAINSALVLLLLFMMTGSAWRSTIAAALFALHPLHVESVAWISERKDVLSAFFGLLAGIAYLRFVRMRSVADYLLLMLLLAAGLMAKPMLVTLPVILLLLDFWPLRRIRTAENPGGDSLRRAMVEKLPLLALSLASAVITVIAQAHGPSLKSTEEFPIAVRLANAVTSYAWYLWDTIWPANLAVGYPYPPNIDWISILVALGMLTAISIACLVQRRRWPHLLAGWMWWAIMLLPVIGLVQVGSQARADRYMYLPSIGLFIMLAWSLPSRAQFPMWSRLAGAAAMVVIAALSVVCIRQVQHWRNSTTLFARAFSVNGATPLISGNLGAALLADGDATQAVSHLTDAARLDDRDPAVRNNLGIAMLGLGHVAEAREQFGLAIAIDPNNLPAHHHLGLLELKQNQPEQAIKCFQEALQIDPGAITPRIDLGTALFQAGRFPEAQVEYERVLQSDPDHFIANLYLGLTLVKLNQQEQAIRSFERAARIMPGSVAAQFQLGKSLSQVNRGVEAADAFHRALQSGPRDAPTAAALGEELARVGRIADSLAAWRMAVRLDPRDPTSSAALASLLIEQTDPSLRNPREALEMATRACQLTDQPDARLLLLLAEAQSDAGNPSGAADTAQRALTQAKLAGSTDLAATIQATVDRYREKVTKPGPVPQR